MTLRFVIFFFFSDFSWFFPFNVFFVLGKKTALRLSRFLTQGKNWTEICLSVIKLAKIERL